MESSLYTNDFWYLGLIVLMPLIGAIFNGLLGSKLPKWVSSTVACAAVGLSFVFTLISIRGLVGNAKPGLSGETLYGDLTYTAFAWMYSGNLSVDVGFLLDPLSAMMLLIITGVGFLIHVYSIGYMANDPGYWRFFTYLNLFIFSMLLLVMGSNLMITFVGWEGVGVCSYLLIGFWYEDMAKAQAGQKAFIVNRIGDFAFLSAMFILFYETGTLDYVALEQMATGNPLDAFKLASLVPTVPILIFIACTGKSAQIPLYTWLPDAMAGPTPVSALIHAATMVTAGVYLIARTNWLFTLSYQSMYVVAVVGILTAFFAATIALAQNDIKKVLAYSTVSQLGYMFAALGVGAFTAGIFHLMTHAFFKALLFLGSGSVIHSMEHAMEHEFEEEHGRHPTKEEALQLAEDAQNIRKMGGLREQMPITAWTFAIGCLAIAGIPIFAGFFSKDAILWGAFANTHVFNIVGPEGATGNSISYLINNTATAIQGGKAVEVVWHQMAVSIFVFVMGVVTAMMTAFYMFRLYFMTFEGTFRSGEKIKKLLHESPLSMALPLMVLALLSVVGGWTGWPHVLAAVAGEGAAHDFMLTFEHWHAEVFRTSMDLRIYNRFGEHPYAMEGLSMGLGLLAATTGIGAAWYFYKKREFKEGEKEPLEAFAPALYEVFQNKYNVDEVYDETFVQGSINVGDRMTDFDQKFLDSWLVNGAAALMAAGGKILRNLQSGNVQRYATYLVMALVMGLIALLMMH